LSQVVLDSGIFIASVYPETLTFEAKGLLHQLQEAQITLHAPTLLRYELIAVSRKAVYQKRITADEGQIARDQRMSYKLAEQYNRPTAYDAQYLALAERMACAFWTADERLFNAVKVNLPGIRWLGNWNPTA